MNTDPAVATVLVVEDDALLREDLVRSLAAAPGLAVRGSAGTLAEARACLDIGPAPDVLLVDLGLPDGDGAALVAQLRVQAPRTRALVLSVFGDEARVVGALAAGAHGYLLKDATPQEVATAIRDVLAGDAPLSPRIARHLLRQFAAGASQPAAAAPVVPLEADGDGGLAPSRLSSREAEVLGLVAHGHTTQEVAQRLSLSAHTVSTHLRNSYVKLAARNRVEAVNRAHERGQIGPAEPGR
jgi:DNA-binding NarL/FixJ family response regulator